MESSLLSKNRPTLRQSVGIIAVASCLAYYNVISAPLLYDDTSAVLNNPDVQEMTKLSDIWSNDFWGHSMTNPSSHKSYRPFTVLLFRYLHHHYGNWSPAYHVTNIILHAVVSVLFFFVCRNLVFGTTKTAAPLAAGLLFGLHPIHTEAVCGAVGCAELLSALCFMLSILIYSYPDGWIDHVTKSEQPIIEQKTTLHINREKKSDSNGNLRYRKNVKSNPKTKHESKQKPKPTNVDLPDQYSYPAAILALIFATIAMLCKESGVTVLGVLLVYELMRRRSKNYSNKRTIFFQFSSDFKKRSRIILIWGFVLLIFRIWMMGWTKPMYTKTENPASYAEERLTRVLTYFYLAWRNFYLLVLPINLSYDYSAGTIPLITTIFEARNFTSLLFLILCISGAALFYFCILWNKESWSKGYALGCSIMVFSFIPASNLLFPVGFVIAERVLYLPSAGYIIIIALLWEKITEKFWTFKQLFEMSMGVLLCFYFYQTVTRSLVWTSKERLFRSGLEVYPNNAKMRYNWGNFLHHNNLHKEAVVEYEKALELQPDSFSALNNLGSMYEVLGRPAVLVEEMYKKAMYAESQNEIGYANLARIYVSLQRNEEVVKVLNLALKNIKHEAPLEKATEVARNLLKQYQHPDAKDLLYRLVQRACLHTEHPARARQCANIYVPELQALSEILQKRGEKKKLSAVHKQMVDINGNKPEVMKSLAKALEVGKSVEETATIMMNNHKKAATQKLKSTKDRRQNREDDAANLWNAAKDLFREERFEESKVLYETYIKANPTNFEAMGQYAAVLFQLGQASKAEKIFREITKKDENCENIGVWINLSTLYGRQEKHVQAMEILSKCIDQREKLYRANDDFRANLFCQLGKHTWFRSQQLEKKGNTKKADILWKEALQNLHRALKIDPNNQEALEAVAQMNAKS